MCEVGGNRLPSYIRRPVFHDLSAPKRETLQKYSVETAQRLKNERVVLEPLQPLDGL